MLGAALSHGHSCEPWSSLLNAGGLDAHACVYWVFGASAGMLPLSTAYSLMTPVKGELRNCLSTLFSSSRAQAALLGWAAALASSCSPMVAGAV